MKYDRYTIVGVLRGPEILMQLKDKGPFPGMWNFPGGKVEPGESFIDGAIREIKEETGIIIPKNNMIHMCNEVFHQDGVDLAILVTQVSNSTQFKQIESEKLMWYNQGDIIDNKIPLAGNLNVPHFVKLAQIYFGWSV